jgi:hypothetical protein
VGDTKEFYRDVDILYKASVQGHRGALHTLLTIGTFTDGVISESMPDIHWVVREYPEMASEIILGDARLKKHFSHWVNEMPNEFR